MIGAGKLNRRIQILKHSITDDGRSEKDDWVPSKKVWASVEWVSDGEKYRAGALGLAVTIRMIVRKTDITSKDRVIYDNKTFALTGVKEVNSTDAFIELTGGLVDG